MFFNLNAEMGRAKLTIKKLSEITAISGITHTVLELKKDFFRQMRSEKKKICHLLV